MNRKTVKILRNVVVVAVIVCGLTWVCSKFVHLGDVEYTDNAQIRRNMIPINSRVQGFIEKVCFDDFQFVQAGDTLVVIECSEYELKVAQAKANYQKAVMENTARETAISTTANNLTVSDANIEELRIRLDQTHNDFLRYEQLYGQKAVTRQQYDNAKADYEATKAKYDMLVRSKRSTSLMKDEQTRRLEQNQTNIDVARAEQHLAELNLSYTVIVAGITVGAGFFFVALKRWKWRIKNIVIAGFVSFLLYQIQLYFLIDASTEKYMLYLPMVFKGAGVSIVYTSLTYALAGCVTFAYYFEAMCVIGFIRTSFGGPLNSAIITRLLNHIKQAATADLGSFVDSMHPMADSFSAVYSEFQRQMLMVSLKEIYGYAAIAAGLILLAIMASDYRHYVGSHINRMLKLTQVWRNVRSRS